MTDTLAQPIVDALRDAYDRLGLLILTNSLWLLGAVTATAGCTYVFAQPVAQLVAAVLSAVIVAGPLTYGLYALWAAVARREYDSFGLLLTGFGRAFPRATGFAALNVLVVALVGFTIAFWLASPSMALKLVGMVWAWLLLVWLIAQSYALPLLVSEGLSLVGTERVALYLLIRHPLASTVLTAHLVGLVALVGFPVAVSSPMLMGASVLVVGLMLFSYTALLHCHFTFRLLRAERAGTGPLAPEPESGVDGEE